MLRKSYWQFHLRVHIWPTAVSSARCMCMLCLYDVSAVSNPFHPLQPALRKYDATHAADRGMFVNSFPHFALIAVHTYNISDTVFVINHLYSIVILFCNILAQAIFPQGLFISFIMECNLGLIPVRLRRPTGRLFLCEKKARLQCYILRAAFWWYMRQEQLAAIQAHPYPDRILLQYPLANRPCLWCGLPTGGFCDGCSAAVCTRCDTVSNGKCPVCAPGIAVYLQYQH